MNKQMSIVKIGTGRKTHIGIHDESISGVKFISVPCGTVKHNGSNVRKAGLKFNLENITCEKCKARYAELTAAEEIEKVEPAEMSEMEMLKYYKENKISFTIAK